MIYINGILQKLKHTLQKVGTAFVGGDKSGNPRGEHSLDIQSGRLSDEHVASGTRSIAIGYNNATTEFGSSAFGASNSIEASASTAIGCENILEDHNDVALGYHNEIRKDHFDACDASSAIGYENYIGSSACNVFGWRNIVLEYWGTAIGDNNTVNHWSSRAFGAWQDLTGGDSLGIGQHNTVYGWRNSAVGNFNDVSGYENQVYGTGNIIHEAPGVTLWTAPDEAHYRFGQCFGYNNEVSGTNSTAVGSSDIIFGSDSMGIGISNTVGSSGQSVDGATAIGINNTVIGESGVAIGNSISIGASGAVGIGEGIINNYQDSIEIGPDNINKITIRSDGMFIFPPIPDGSTQPSTTDLLDGQYTMMLDAGQLYMVRNNGGTMERTQLGKLDWGNQSWPI